MTPLRQQMIDVMTLKGLSPQTQKSYLYALSQMARYFQRSPDLLDTQDVERYCLYLLQERQLAPASVRIVVNAVVFLFGQVLGRAPVELRLRYPKLPQRIPALLTREEVQRLLAHCPNERHYTLLALCYGTGVRVSELVNLRVADIDSARCVIHVRQGKGGKDRVVLLTPTLLVLLRRYWQAYRPVDALFYGHVVTVPMSIRVPQKAYRRARQAAGITKPGGIHSLRHAYASHQLEAGMAVFKLQRLLGHRDIRTTQRYIHWIPQQGTGSNGVDLLSTTGGFDSCLLR